MVPGLWLNEGGQSAAGAAIDHIIASHPATQEARERAIQARQTLAQWLADAVAGIGDASQAALVHPAGIQDRHGCVLLMHMLYGRFPFLKKLIADGGCQGPIFAEGVKKAMNSLAVAIVKRSDAATGFEVLPLRWIVERSIGWHGRCRRFAKDDACLTKSALAFPELASIGIMLRRLCMGWGTCRTDSDTPVRQRAPCMFPLDRRRQNRQPNYLISRIVP